VLVDCLTSASPAWASDKDSVASEVFPAPDVRRHNPTLKTMCMTLINAVINGEE
jgi:hypothetical protein